MEYVKLYITMLLKTDPSPEKLALVPRTIFLPSPDGRRLLFVSSLGGKICFLPNLIDSSPFFLISLCSIRKNTLSRWERVC